MPKLQPVTIPPTSNPETLRKFTVQHLNALSQQIAGSSQRTEPMDMGQNQINNVADPGNALDAVNLRTLKKYTQYQTHPPQQVSGNSLYSVVFSYNGAVVAGVPSPPYIIMPSRAGTPVSVKVAVTGTGTGTGSFNISWIHGTATATVLSTGITLPAGSSGPITSTAFASGVTFAVNDLLTPVVSASGGVSNLTIEVEIQP